MQETFKDEFVVSQDFPAVFTRMPRFLELEPVQVRFASAWPTTQSEVFGFENLRKRRRTASSSFHPSVDAIIVASSLHSSIQSITLTLASGHGESYATRL